MPKSEPIRCPGCGDELDAERAGALPGAFAAFRRTDDRLIAGEYTWVGESDYFDDDDPDEPYEVEEVVMIPVLVRRWRVGTHPFEPCDDNDQECDRCGGEPGGTFHA